MPKIKTLKQMITEYEGKPTSVLTQSDFPTEDIEQAYRALLGIYRAATNDRKRKISRLSKTVAKQKQDMDAYYDGTSKTTNKLRDLYQEQFEEKNIFLDKVRDESIELLNKIFFVDSEQNNFAFEGEPAKLVYTTTYGHKVAMPELIDLMFHNNIKGKTFSGKEHEIMFRKLTHFEQAPKSYLTEKVDTACQSMMFDKLLNLNSELRQNIISEEKQNSEIDQTSEKLNKKIEFAKKLRLKRRVEKLNKQLNEQFNVEYDNIRRINAEEEVIKKIEIALSALEELNMHYSPEEVDKIEATLEKDLTKTESELYKSHQTNKKKADNFVEETSDQAIKLAKIKDRPTIFGEYKIEFDKVLDEMKKDQEAFGSFLVAIGEKYESLDSIKASAEEKNLIKLLRSTFAQHLEERDKKELKEKRLQNLKSR